jgi:hypothetical protein
MKTLTPQQTIRRVSNLVWKAGDRDLENAVKHVGYALQAINAGDHWYDGADYLLPGGDAQYEYENDGKNRPAYIAYVATISSYWAILEDLRDDLGGDLFTYILNGMAEDENADDLLVYSALIYTRYGDVLDLF